MSRADAALEAARLRFRPADLLAPGALAPGRAFPDALYRVLGVRQVAQALLTGRLVGHRAGAAVDAAHAVSMAVVALVSSRYRRAALAQAGLASAFALAETASGRRR